MIGRGALIKPWIFKEIAEDKEWLPTAVERVESLPTVNPVYERTLS